MAAELGQSDPLVSGVTRPPVEVPNIGLATAALRSYLEDRQATLSENEARAVREAIRRFERLVPVLQELVELNARLHASNGFAITFDRATNIMTSTAPDGTSMRLQFEAAGPNPGIEVLASGGSYVAGGASRVHSNDDRMRMEDLLEAFYYSAFRACRLLERLPGLPNKIRPTGVRVVRNQLIEHVEAGALYGFGYGDTGPRVRPFRQSKGEENDPGLLPNAHEMVNKVVSVVEAARRRG